MKKSIVIVLLCLFYVFKTNAQQKPQLNVGAEITIPMGNASDVYNVGLGGSVKVSVPVTAKLQASLSAGYTGMFLRTEIRDELHSYGINISERGFLPLKAGARYFFTEYYYLQGEAGVAIGTNKGTGTAFAFSPGMGYSVPLGGKANAFDLGIRYEGWNKSGSILSQFGVRLAYSFEL